MYHHLYYMKEIPIAIQLTCKKAVLYNRSYYIPSRPWP